MGVLNDNRTEEGRLAGNVAVLCAFSPLRDLSSSYQYKNSALSISFKIKAIQIKPQNSTCQVKRKTKSIV